ncbi:unnamed protein product [Rangifer tarandus platyrhynchus]|uniref:Uncharacterized protein n=1 Tax=Rangifer tarandus platyrhynchus TaxID=3082113 RepID=A0AC59YJX7_RANTA
MRWALRCLPAPPAQPELPQGPSPPPAWHSFCQVRGSVAVHLWAPSHCHQDNVKMMSKTPSHPCFWALEPVPAGTHGPSASAGPFQRPRLQSLGGSQWRFMSVFPRFFSGSLLPYSLKEHAFIYSFHKRPPRASRVLPPGNKDLIQYTPWLNTYFALVSETSFSPAVH